MNKSAYSFILIVLAGCSSISNKEARPHYYYSDIDIFNMVGIAPMKTGNLVPPYFEIDSIGPNEVRLTNRYPKIAKESRGYKKSDDYWSTNFTFNADTINLKAYIYIGHKQITSLEYDFDDSAMNKLKSAICESRMVNWKSHP
jgi:hypothetical protein